MIEMICGAYGAKGRLIRPADGPFTLSADEEKRLVERGVARYVHEEESTPPVNGPEKSGGEPVPDTANLEDMTKPELLEMAAKLGVDVNERMNKTTIIHLIMEASTAKEESAPPDLSPEDPVE